MHYAVLLCCDSAGATPLILRDDSEALVGRESVHFRSFTETDDHGEAERVAELLRRQIAAREV